MLTRLRLAKEQMHRLELQSLRLETLCPAPLKGRLPILAGLEAVAAAGDLVQGLHITMVL